MVDLVRRISVLGAAGSLLVGCAGTPSSPPGTATVGFTSLSSDATMTTTASAGRASRTASLRGWTSCCRGAPGTRS